MHQVWCLFGTCPDDKKIKPLEEDHELYVWYERMVDVAISILYVSVSPEIRRHSCFLRSMDFHQVHDTYWCLASHYDRAEEDMSDIEGLHL